MPGSFLFRSICKCTTFWRFCLIPYHNGSPFTSSLSHGTCWHTHGRDYLCKNQTWRHNETAGDFGQDERGIHLIVFVTLRVWNQFKKEPEKHPNHPIFPPLMAPETTLKPLWHKALRICSWHFFRYSALQALKTQLPKSKKALIYKAFSVVGLVGLEPMTSTMSILVVI